MRASTFTEMTPDGTGLHVHRWLPDGPARAIVQIAHGMAEHSARYARFAGVLTDAGFAVYAGDHRGHGGTATRSQDEGYFADADGFQVVVEDLHRVAETARGEQPGLPFFLFGHSMGSFLCRAYAMTYGEELDGLILSGTAGDPGVLGKVGKGIAAVESRLRGRRHKSVLLDKLTFGQYNTAFKPNRTKFDWLSRDDAEVDKYVADPQCGNVFTSAFFVDLLSGLAKVNSDAEVASVPTDLPIYLMSGSLDPVGANAKGVRQVSDQLLRAGVNDVTTHIWPEGRHEMLNETNRDEVMAHVVAWIDEHLPTA